MTLSLRSETLARLLQSRKALLSLLGAFALGALFRGLVSRPKRKSIIRSPRETLLPLLIPEEHKSLPYPPDILPGARDIDSPYGSIRVYEWGSEKGRKVLFIHGISTPSLALGAVAHALVEKGCRVMLFDLFGRGYSDSPGDLQQDERLFSTQILIALTSSPLSWTDDESGGFSLIGYSLGGGIAASFTSHFPRLVSSLVLLAPSGMLRPSRISGSSRILYSEGIIPEALLAYLIRRRLRTTTPPSRPASAEEPVVPVTAAVQEELPNLESNSDSASLSKSHPELTVASAVNFQVQNHKAFVRSFMSSIRHAPIVQQRDDWSQIGKRLTRQNTRSEGLPEPGDLQNGLVLLICGQKDPIIVAAELQEDAEAVLEGNAAFRSVDAGHEFPITHSSETAEHIWEFWTTQRL